MRVKGSPEYVSWNVLYHTSLRTMRLSAFKAPLFHPSSSSPQYSSTITTRSAKNRVRKTLNRRKKCRIKLVNRPNTLHPDPSPTADLWSLNYKPGVVSRKKGGGIEMLLGRISRAKIMSDPCKLFCWSRIGKFYRAILFTITLFRYREQRPKLYVCYSMKIAFYRMF